MPIQFRCSPSYLRERPTKIISPPNIVHKLKDNNYLKLAKVEKVKQVLLNDMFDEIKY